MLVYVVCEEAPWDSYHALILVTLDKAEAREKVADFNSNHEEDCRTQRKTESDYDECFCMRYHMHEIPLKGITDKVRRLAGMSDLTSAPVCGKVAI